MTAIRTQGLSKRYGDTVALDSLSLEVADGEVSGLLGPQCDPCREDVQPSCLTGR